MSKEDQAVFPDDIIEAQDKRIEELEAEVEAYKNGAEHDAAIIQQLGNALERAISKSEGDSDE